MVREKLIQRIINPLEMTTKIKSVVILCIFVRNRRKELKILKPRIQSLLKKNQDMKMTNSRKKKKLGVETEVRNYENKI